MTQIDETIASYYALHPISFHALERLEIRQWMRDGVHEITLEIELRAKDAADNRRLALTFDGVSILKYVPSPGELAFFLEIISIRERQWEVINYRVFESEQDTELSFFCRDFSAKIR